MGARAGREKQGESRDRGGIVHENQSFCQRERSYIGKGGRHRAEYAVTGFTLSQEAGEIPVLTLKVPITDGADIELPDGIVIANIEKPEE